MRGRLLVAAALASALCAAPTAPADLSTYRGFHFGESIAASAKQAGVDASRSRLVHNRPAVLEELDWRPESLFRTEGKKIDSVRDALLRFYNGQLFQIVATYDRSQIEGLTESDLVEAISRMYGTVTKTAEEIPYHSNYGETAKVLARWESGEYSCDLIRTGDQNSFALVLSSKRLNVLARAAILEAVRLDAIEAPEREAESKRKAAASSQSALDKARSANLPNFNP